VSHPTLSNWATIPFVPKELLQKQLLPTSDSSLTSQLLDQEATILDIQNEECQGNQSPNTQLLRLKGLNPTQQVLCLNLLQLQIQNQQHSSCQWKGPRTLPSNFHQQPPPPFQDTSSQLCIPQMPCSRPQRQCRQEAELCSAAL
jgi:hypothetical protein